MKTSILPHALAALALVATASPARAGDPPSRRAVAGSLAVGVASVPAYEGARNRQTIPLVAGDVRLGERYVAIEGTGLRSNLLANRHLELGPVANLTFGRDRRRAPAAVGALGSIDDAYEVGVFGAIKRGSVLRRSDEAKLRLQGVRDVSGVHDGWLLEGALAYRLPVGSRASVTTDLSMRFADEGYATTYFSVGARGAGASGLPAFAAKGGVKDLGIAATAAVALSGRWTLIGYGGYRRLVGDFADSPVVKNGGDADQLSGGLGLGYSF